MFKKPKQVAVKPKLSDLPDWVNRFDNFFITGSVRFGCETDESDLDVVLPIWEREDVLKSITRKDDMEESKYNVGVKITNERGAKINFVFLHPLDYVSWNKAAEMIDLSNLFRNNQTICRPLRHSIHEALCAAVKTSFSGHTVLKDNMTEFLTNGPKEEKSSTIISIEPPTNGQDNDNAFWGGREVLSAELGTNMESASDTQMAFYYFRSRLAAETFAVILEQMKVFGLARDYLVETHPDGGDQVLKFTVWYNTLQTTEKKEKRVFGGHTGISVMDLAASGELRVKLRHLIEFGRIKEFDLKFPMPCFADSQRVSEQSNGYYEIYY
jgi:hypothetical protein